jgi:hypothetical protein
MCSHGVCHTSAEERTREDDDRAEGTSSVDDDDHQTRLRTTTIARVRDA